MHFPQSNFLFPWVDFCYWGITDQWNGLGVMRSQTIYWWFLVVTTLAFTEIWWLKSKVKVKRVAFIYHLFYLSFKGSLQLYLPAGNSPILVESHLEVIGSASSPHWCLMLSYPMFLLVLILSTHTEGWRVESTPSQVESGAGIEPGTCCMMVCCSTNWAIPLGCGAKAQKYCRLG